MPNLPSDRLSLTLPNTPGDEPCWELPRGVMHRADISAGAKVMYAVLSGHRDPATEECNPRLGKLARAMGTTKLAVQGFLNELRDAQLISWHNGVYGCSYTFSPLGRKGR